MCTDCYLAAASQMQGFAVFVVTCHICGYRNINMEKKNLWLFVQTKKHIEKCHLGSYSRHFPFCLGCYRQMKRKING